MNEFVIIGAGGIGYHLAEPLVRFVNFKFGANARITIIDGDRVEEKNLERQHDLAALNKNKAEILVETLRKRFKLNCHLSAVAKYYTQKTKDDEQFSCLKDSSTVFVCVDNDMTRVFIEMQLEKLPNATMVVGGNDFATGQAQLFIREKGQNLTPKISQIAPEILQLKDEFPDEVGCDVAVVSQPQLIFVNSSVANAMLNLWYSQVYHRDKIDPILNEVLVNVQKASAHQFTRQALRQ